MQDNLILLVYFRMTKIGCIFLAWFQDMFSLLKQWKGACFLVEGRNHCLWHILSFMSGKLFYFEFNSSETSYAKEPHNDIPLSS